MLQDLQKVLDVLLILEPNRDPLSFPVRIVETVVGDVVHTHMIGTSDKDANWTHVREISLAELLARPTCPDTCEQKSTRWTIVDALTDYDLQVAANELLEWQEISPLNDNDHEQIVAKITDLDSFVDLGFEYVTYEESLYESFSQTCIGDHPETYEDILLEEHQRTVDELGELKKRTLGCVRGLDLLAAKAQELFGIERDETDTITMFGRCAVNLNANPIEEERFRIAHAARMAYQDFSDLYSSTLTIAPRWVAELVRACTPAAVQSSLYPVGMYDEVTIETAITLWRDSDDAVLSNFDAAVQAADRLIRG